MTIVYLETESIHDKIFDSFGVVIKTPESKPNLDNYYEVTWADYLPESIFSDMPFNCYMITKKVPPICHSMECIIGNSEAYINMGKSKSILFVAPSTIEQECDEAKIKAFLLQPGESVVINAGIWHFTPIPLDCDNPFLLILAKQNLQLNSEKVISLNETLVKVKELSNSYGILDRVNN